MAETLDEFRYSGIDERRAIAVSEGIPDQSAASQFTVEEPVEASAAPGVWTVRRILDWTIGHFKTHGCDSPRLDAEILLAHARGCQRIQLYTDYNTPLTDTERARMRELVVRRATLEPVAYLVGFREFFSLDFEVESGVLIPRPDTETLVVQLLELAKEYPQPRILELCTGTACIAVAAAVNCKAASVKTIEIDDKALSVAARNIAKHKVEDRVELVQGDLFEPLATGEQFDIIASNPPYVTTSEIATLQPDVRLHEPHLALDGGPDGLDLVRKIIAQAGQYLVSGGGLLIEISSEQAEQVVELLAQQTDFQPAEIAHDLGGLSRVVWARKK
jgi:release factor glutamine methyltransferase